MFVNKINFIYGVSITPLFFNTHITTTIAIATAVTEQTTDIMIVFLFFLLAALSL